MTETYTAKPVTIWTNALKEIAASRIEGDLMRSSGQEEGTVKDHFDIIFEPTNVLANDLVSFVNLIRKITLT